MTLQEYQAAVEWLFVQAPNYQIDGKRAYKPGLDNIKKLCAHFGNPQDKIKTVHIGGTNGKGSTSNMLASVLQEAGYKIGLYNSPHLIDFTERIKVNGENANREFVFGFVQKLKTLPHDIRPSFFEFTTIMAFEYFYQQKVDIAIIEVGLGGRLDSTNIITPLVTAITNVALDHQNILGDTVSEIAIQKAGIIKPGVPIVCGDEDGEIQKIIADTAQDQKSPFVDATKINTQWASDLKGHYQQKNIRVVISLIEELKSQAYKISDEHIKQGLQNVHRNTGFIGRWFEFSKDPLIICDTAHNAAGLDLVFAQLSGMPQHKHIVLGFVKDKKVEDIFPGLPRNAEYYFVKPAIQRGKHPAEYEDLLKTSGIDYKIFDTVDKGFKAAKSRCTGDDMIFIGGSNFVVGEFLEKNLQK